MYRFGPARSERPLSPRPLGQGLIKPKYDDGQTEPSLAEVLSDPIVHAVMARDSVTPEALSGHILAAQKGMAVQGSRSIIHSDQRRAA